MNEPHPGETIAGRYRLDRELARGGMGSVWAAHDDKLQRRVAVKLVAPDGRAGLDGAEALRRFEAEAMAVAKLQSPHVVQIFDFGREADTPFIVMELLDGEDLRTRLHRHKRVSLETAALILVQTAKALSVAHAAGIVHRDLKPGNIFLVRAGEEEIVKVLDFGVAVQSADLEELADAPIMGTPQFMSPEQARGLPDLDHRADLWSLGVIIYKALTSRLPFNASAPTDVIVQVCTMDPEPVSKLAPDLPRELDAFFAKALARDPEARFASAREMALAFSRISPVNFTTLSMPDPKMIEAAIAQAKASSSFGAARDDEALTVAVDAETRVRLEDDLDDLKTSVHIPPSLASSPAMASGRGSAPGASTPGRLPTPNPPPISRRGRLVAPDDDSEEEPLTVVAAAALESLLDDADDSEDEVEPPSSPQNKYPSVPTLAAIERRRTSAPPPSRRGLSTPLLVAGAMAAGLVVAVIGSLLAGRATTAETGLSQAPAALGRDTLASLAESPGDAAVEAVGQSSEPSGDGEADDAEDDRRVQADGTTAGPQGAAHTAGQPGMKPGPEASPTAPSSDEAPDEQPDEQLSGGNAPRAEGTAPPVAASKPAAPPPADTKAPPADRPTSDDDVFAERL